MRQVAIFLLGVACTLGGWWLLRKLEIRGLAGRPPGSSETPFEDGTSPTSHNADLLPASGSRGSVRIASFNVQVFGESKAKKARIMDFLARIVRQFDVVALQELRCRDRDLLPNFVELVNAAGRRYDFVIGQPVGRGSNVEQYAFLYDAATVEVDRTQLYPVADPDDLLLFDPYVAWFRVRGPPANQAFTFSLVNVHTDPEQADQEVNALDDVYRAVRDDGRQEDDVIILGTLNVDAEHMGQLGQTAGMTTALANVPTNTQGTHQLDNVVFHSRATVEFSGRSGIFDFLRAYNLTMDEALEVSDHLPVWAEFSVYEGGQPGRVASRPSK